MSVIFNLPVNYSVKAEKNQEENRRKRKAPKKADVDLVIATALCYNSLKGLCYICPDNVFIAEEGELPFAAMGTAIAVSGAAAAVILIHRKQK